MLDSEDSLALRGQSILSKTISIKQLLHEQQLREVAYGPLPDAGHLEAIPSPYPLPVRDGRVRIEMESFEKGNDFSETLTWAKSE